MQRLEEYIFEMENSDREQNLQNGDIWSQLQQKENNLVIAAELGRALLEKNEELKKNHEATVEEYCKRIETLEQEKHILKRKLASSESELEIRIAELENDVTELTTKLSTKENILKQWERDKINLFTDLNAQNLRLTSQLKEATTLESQLKLEVRNLKEQCALEKLNLHQHISTSNILRDELQLMSDMKNELEKRLMLSNSERDSLTATLEEASERILVLETHLRKKDFELYKSSVTHDELNIDERLGNDVGEHHSLVSEMDLTEPIGFQECMTIYRQLRSLCLQLKNLNETDSGLQSDCSTTSLNESNFSVELLNEVAQELITLVLDTDVVRLLERLEQAKRDIQERDTEISKLNQTNRELMSKVSVNQVELKAALEERDRARQDALHSSLDQDDEILKARKIRDQAVFRKNKAEIELAKTRVDLMQVNSQLLEAIQQKVELSQQLEQWQVDMQDLLDEQLRNKLNRQEMKKINNDQISQPVVPPRRRILRFFQR